jgi:hypothetical protein
MECLAKSRRFRRKTMDGSLVLQRGIGARGLMLAQFFGCLACASSLPLHGGSVSAETIRLESATLGSTQPGGLAVNATHFIGWRFEVQGEFAVTQVGGHLAGLAGNEIFAAIVPLETITSFPEHDAFDSEETVRIIVGPLQPWSEDLLYPMSTTLTAGSYALVFGTEEFGASGTGAIVNSSSQQLIAPTTTDSFIFGDRPQSSGPLTWDTGPTLPMRFVVDGTALAGTADYEQDGDIDLGDLAVWTTHFGLAAGATIATGSADNDGDTDGMDFLAWQQQFGDVVPLEIISTAIPEPTSQVLLIASVVGALVVRPRREGLVL